MSTLVTSDLHGYALDKFLDLLEKAQFSAADRLYVIGDVIDRNGDGGIAMLRWIMQQNNITLILGNHEDMMLKCESYFLPDSDPPGTTWDLFEDLMQWDWNGSDVTVRALSKLDHNSTSEIFHFLRSCPYYKEMNVGGKDFILVHGGLGNFAPGKPLSNYAPKDLVWHRPTKKEEYFKDKTVILGHTPTKFFGSPDKMFTTDTWIDIDTGAADRGGSPMLLRLDDMYEFYVRQ